MSRPTIQPLREQREHYEPPQLRNLCVLVADAARGRVLVREGTELVELAAVSNPLLHTPHAVAARHEIERMFAAQLAAETAAVWRLYPGELVVVAPPAMLAVLRPALGRQLPGVALRELAGDHAKLSAPKLHELLARGLPS